MKNKKGSLVIVIIICIIIGIMIAAANLWINWQSWTGGIPK